MKPMQAVLWIGLGLGVTACTAVDLPSRHSGIDELTLPVPTTQQGVTTEDPVNLSTPEAVISRQSVAQDTVPAASIIAAPVSVQALTVRVPRALSVSERNRYLPFGDIVWREDPIGDRHEQVQKIVLEAMMVGITPLQGPGKVDIEVTLVRFHALTEKARYTTGGVHAITFDLTLKEPGTGALLLPTRRVRADLDGYGGQQAINAEARGQTQKVRISDHLTKVIRQELTDPEGYQNANLGFMQLLNTL